MVNFLKGLVTAVSVVNAVEINDEKTTAKTNAITCLTQTTCCTDNHFYVPMLPWFR